ncbi:MAG: Zn-ribbon domain-containing OB-fold protein [Caldisphaeraceae archaeon]|nr:Zn-ribbon domain-containing OB-fold protein [Caldisphaeraceae archaeon]MEB3692499.1 Zn-ribbon domain-containing OB-fold protein [Caldisphaeraceae archaeon]MEB3798400.1 Zn-ribbon domain-containing OB-fold protein [Caldisphaeraceae archaeon]
MPKSQREEAEKFLNQLETFANSMKSSIGLPMIVDPKTNVAIWYDQRELKLRFMISVEKTRKFFESLSEGKLMATKCSRTGEILFPPQIDCPTSIDSEIEWVPLPKEGELLTYTVINTKPFSFSHYDDYTVGIAKLTNGVQVLAWVRETDPKKLKVGMKVKVEIVKREPEGYLTYELVPA